MNKKLEKILLLGIPVDNINMDQAINNIFSMIEQHKYDNKDRLVATANVDFIINAYKHKDKEKSKQLLHVLRNSDMVTADGMPLVWLSKLLGYPLPERVTGADMVPRIAEKCAMENKSLYLLGGKSGAAEKTVDILQKKYPGLKIAGYDSPMIDIHDEDENKNIIARINIANPDVLLIALGNPKQELWFDNNKKFLNVPVSIGVGGTFEFIAGMVSRAPKWIQKIGMEWFYRIFQDPKRLLKRYAVDLVSFSMMVLPLLVLHFFHSFTAKLKGMKAFKFFVDSKMNSQRIDIKQRRDELARIQKLDINFNNNGYVEIPELTNIFQLIFSARENRVNVNLVKTSKYLKLWFKVNKLDDLLTQKAGALSENPGFYFLDKKYIHGV